MAAERSVLVVEDDADIRDSLLVLLHDEGYRVSACSNGLEALERLRVEESPDVILLDLMMPVMDGWQFRVQQKRDARLASIPVVVLSADTTAKAAAMDADAYLRKPVEYTALVSSIERTILGVERKNLQATLVETERLAALGTLAAGVAHEINNPLAYVIANLGYLARVAQNDSLPTDMARFRDAIEDSREGCDRIRSIVRDLQLFSRAADDDEEAVDVRRVLDSSANIVMNEIRPRARLTKDYAQVPKITANATRLGQVFLNLILNAAQAIPEGAPSTNEIRLVVRAGEGEITIEVRDTGAGIAAADRSKIFEPFFTTKPLGLGTGLGLSITRRIVTGMGGDISVESTVGRGTTFYIHLPISHAKASQPAPRLEPRDSPRRGRILAIDDEPMIGATLVRVLGDQHEIAAVTDPEVGIAKIAGGERYDLVLCDMRMPGRSGMDVYEAIARIAPEQARRMIFLTGGASSQSAQEFLNASGRVVIEKPFAVDDLLARIDTALAKIE